MKQCYELHQSDCLEAMCKMQDKSFDAVITDPPYGCKKASWDDEFPVLWYQHATRIARMVVIITGSQGIKDVVNLVGDDFIDVIAARNLNGMTRGPLGFGNWLSAVVCCQKPRPGPNAFEFCITKDKPPHPTPKPINYMTQLVARVTEEGESILDPFMGSGTTGVACVQLLRKFTGIENDPTHFEYASRRIATSCHQLNIFQETMP